MNTHGHTKFDHTCACVDFNASNNNNKMHRSKNTYSNACFFQLCTHYSMYSMLKRKLQRGRRFDCKIRLTFLLEVGFHQCEDIVKNVKYY